MVTYDQGDGRTSSDQQTHPTGRESATHLGRPRPGGALARTRSWVRLIRLMLIVLAVVCGFVASSTSETDVETSDRWTVVMAAAICLIPLGGLFWWVERQPTERLRRWQRRRTVGRWLRALLATGGLVLFFLGIFFDADERIWIFGLSCFLCSPVIAFLFAAGGPSDTELRLTATRAGGSDRRTRAAALAAVGEFCTVLVERDDPTGSTLPRSATIRPRAPLGVPVPARLRAWLEHGQLATDGRSISVTDARGTVHTRRLAVTPEGEHANGVATLLVRRERAATAEQRERSAPLTRQHLTLLDTEDRRVLDLELYGWTRSELVDFARASGLELRDYGPTLPVETPASRATGSGMPHGGSPVTFDAAHPRALDYARAAGGSVLGDHLLTAGLVFAILALTAVAVWFGGWANARWLDPGSGWSGIARVGWMLLVVIPGSALATFTYGWLHRRRHAVPGPSGAI